MTADPITTLNGLMESTESLKEKVVFKYAISLLEVLHGKQSTRWTPEEMKRLPDILQQEDGFLMPMKHQGRGFVRWR